MMTRNTSTGTLYETSIKNLLLETNLDFKSQVNIGAKRNGKGHRVDFVIENTLVSTKYQKVGGTAEEKIPFEFMKLQHAVQDYGYDNAIIVLHGDSGWTWKDYFLSTEFKAQMKELYPDVSIMTHKEFCSIYIE